MTDELDAVRRLRPQVTADPAVLARERSRLMSTIAPEAAGSSATTSPPPGWPRITPHLIYEDVPAALDWLARAFGFRERTEGRFVDDEGAIGHAEMVLAGGTIMLGPPSIHGGSPRSGVSTMLSVYIDDVDAHCARARAAGAEIVLEPEDAHWGDRRYQCRDPEGHQWHFCQRPQRHT